MSKRLSSRQAISALLDADKTPTAIVRDLKCARSLVYKVKALKQKNGGNLGHAYVPRTKTVLTPRVRVVIQRRFKSAPTKALRQVAREAGVGRDVVTRVVREAGWRSLRCKKVPLISAEGRQKRATRAAGLLNKLKSARAGTVIFFSDEKTFVLDPAYNPQNDRWIRFQNDDDDDDACNGSNDSEDEAGDHTSRGKYLPCEKHPGSAMFLGAVACTGEVSPPIWYPVGFRLGADDYIKSLQDIIVPWMKEVAATHGGHFIFQQNSAPAHRSRKTQQFLQEQNVPFWRPTDWPPNSPDLNPLDYAVWSMIVQGACKNRPTSVTALKRKVSAFWNRIDPEKIRAICRKFRPRLEKCVAKNGYYFH